MDPSIGLHTPKIRKDHSSSSGSVVTDHDDGIADYADDHGCLPSPTVYTRPVSELLNSCPATTTATGRSPSKKTSSKRSTKKRVVSVPIAEIESLKTGGGDCTPPPDAWTWRKYGQKPIKGSPYPRGYYRCSSSKGCPARKQVERSRLDPSVVVVTYASEHNHPMPVPRSHVYHQQKGHGHGNSRRGPVTPKIIIKEETEEAEAAAAVTTATDLIVPSTSPTNGDESSSPVESSFTDLSDASSFMTIGNDFGWFSGLVETPLPTTGMLWDEDGDEGMMQLEMHADEDDALFAGLGELPECAVVFRKQFSLTSWCGSSLQ